MAENSSRKSLRKPPVGNDISQPKSSYQFRHNKGVYGRYLDIHKSLGNTAINQAFSEREKDIIPPAVEQTIRSIGKPLDPAIKKEMGDQFNEGFEQVRIHDDEQANASARAIGAKAYTVGRDIVFKDDAYDPNTAVGKELIAHELTHVIQQRKDDLSSNPTHLTIASPDNSLEQEANDSGSAIQQGSTTVSVQGSANVSIQKQHDPDYREQVERMSDDQLHQELNDVEATLNDTIPTSPEWFELVRQKETLLDVLATRGFVLADPVAVMPGRSRVAQQMSDQHRQQLEQPFSHYVDDFSEVVYDMFDPPGPNLSKILRVHYADGTMLMINIDDIGDSRTVSATDMIGDNAFYVGAGGRTFPRVMNGGTVPNLYAAKREALIQMDEYNVDFITLATFPVMLVISPPIGGVAGGVSVRRVPVGSYRGGGRVPSAGTAGGGGRGGGGTPPQEPPPSPPPPQAAPVRQPPSGQGSRQMARVPSQGTGGNVRGSVRQAERTAPGGERGPRPPSPGPWRGRVTIENGNQEEGWIHIEGRHVTGNHPDGPGDLFAAGTTREELQSASQTIVSSGNRISQPSRRIQVFERRMTIHGQSDRVRVVVDSRDGRVITIFPVRGGGH